MYEKEVVCHCPVFVCRAYLCGNSSSCRDQNPILKKLVEKGILTPEEATAVMQEMEKETVGKEKEVEQKIEKKVTEAVQDCTSPGLTDTPKG